MKIIQNYIKTMLYSTANILIIQLAQLYINIIFLIQCVTRSTMISLT